MSNATFVPAIGEQFNSVWDRKKLFKGKDGKEYDLKFFTENSHFQIESALQSAYYGLNGVGKENGKTFREMIGWPKDRILIGDSGGFQIASFKKRGEVCNLTPLESLRWQEANCDVAMNLDVPSTLWDIPTYEDFMQALNESIANFEVFEKERKNYDMKLLNVIHGENIKLMEIWYEKVKHFKFDGWAIGMKPASDPLIQAMAFCFLWEKGEFKKDSTKWLHFFGMSGKHVVPTLVYAASKLNIPVTYDSSSYNIGSIYRTYYLPFDIGPHLSFGDKFVRENPHLKELPCICPVCQSIGDMSILNGTDIYAGTLISLHNLFQYRQYNNICNALVEDKEKFLDYLVKINISEKTLKSIEFIDHALEKGVYSAIEKFKDYLISQELIKHKQSSIWGF